MDVLLEAFEYLIGFFEKDLDDLLVKIFRQKFRQRRVPLLLKGFSERLGRRGRNLSASCKFLVKFLDEFSGYFFQANFFGWTYGRLVLLLNG